MADRGFSSTQNYGLAVDTAGNALLAFNDDSGADVQIAAAKVARLGEGASLWTSSHVKVYDDPGDSRVLLPYDTETVSSRSTK